MGFMSFGTVTGLVIETLLVTNLFIFIYNGLLQFLNTAYPSSLPTEFIRIGAAPEPFEMPLYVLLIFFASTALWLFHRKTKYEAKKLLFGKKTLLHQILLVLLLALFVTNLNSYPMAHSVYPYQNLDSRIVYFGYFLFMMMIFVPLFLFSIISKFRFFFPIILVVIAFLTFEPRFPIVGHDYSYFFGPVWEVLTGRTLYTDTPSQYGFVSILLLAVLHKLNLLNISSLPILVWFLYIAEYTIIFYLIYRVGKSLGLAYLGLIAVVVVNYYSIYHLPASIPQAGPLRWIPLILSILVAYKFKSLTSKYFIFFTAIASLWVLDSGFFLIIAFLATLLLLFMTKNISWRQFLKSIILLLLSQTAFFLIINGFHLLFGYKPVNIVAVFLKIQQYAKAGFGMIPISSHSYFWVTSLLYFVSVIYFLRKKTPDFTDQILLFSTNISAAAAIYFVGRSHVHNLFHLALFPILNAYLFFGLILKNFGKKPKFLVLTMLFLIFVVYPAYNRQEVMAEMIKEKIKRFNAGSIFTPEWTTQLPKKYNKEISLIKNNITEEQIVILSPDDTYLFYLTGKKNLLKDNSQITILTKKDMDASLSEVYQTCPERIVVDCTLFKQCVDSKPFSQVAFFSIQPILLDSIQKNCNVSYQPAVCTEQLCIAKSEKKY